MFKLLPRNMRKFLPSSSSLRFPQVLIILVIITYFFYIGISLDSNNYGGNYTKSKSTTNTKYPSLFSIPKRAFTYSSTTTDTSAIIKNCFVTIAIILCEDDRYLSLRKNKTGLNPPPTTTKIIAKDFSRQINQTLVLLKSIAILSKYGENKSCVEVIILSDSSKHYDQIKTEMQMKWSPEYQELIKLTSIPVRYPSGSGWMKKMFRPCATFRLFLAEILDGWDSVIYLDTDIIFFQSVQALWEQFKRFDDEDDNRKRGGARRIKKIAGMAPCLFHYGSGANEVPYFGSSGLNAGIMLMNLTRMRESQWTNRIRMVTTMFQDKIKLADQDILNIYFHFFPEELHLLTCDWNFRPFQCREGSTCEDPEISQGISALHGNALSFTAQGPEPLFRSVFQTFHRTKLDSGFELERFVNELESSFLSAEESTFKINSKCKQFGGLDVLLLNRLYSLVERD